MATYYIDFVGGSDTSSGTSTSTPWKHCPGDANATGVADACTPAAGDSLIFKGGVQYDGAITLKSSGSVGNVITYDGNSAGTWGTGKAIIDGGGTLSNLITDGWSLRHYLTIKNFIIRNTDWSSTNSHGIYFYPGASAYAISIEDCEITDAGGDCIQTIGDVQIFVRRCQLHDCGVDGIKGDLGDGTIIEDCDFYNFTSVANHGDGVQVHGVNSGATITIRRNRWWNNTQDIYMSAWGSVASGNIIVHSNVIWKSSTGDYNGIIVDTETAGASFGTISIYHNTLIDLDTGSGGIRVVDRGGGIDTLNVYNNLFYNSTIDVSAACIGTLNRDYNLFTNSVYAAAEAHGQYWSSGTGLFNSYASQDFDLAVNTDAGTDLGASYNTDFNGDTRTTWSRGAYEYGSGGGAASPYVRVY